MAARPAPDRGDVVPDTGHIAADERRRIAELELNTVMGNGQGFSPVYLLLMVAFVWLMYPAVGIVSVTLWVGSYAIYIVGRTVATMQYHLDPFKFSPERIRFWRLFVGKSAFTHAVILGSTGILALPVMDPTSRIVLTSFLVVVCAGCSAYAAALFGPLAVLITVSLLPYIVVWWPLSTEMGQPVAGQLMGAMAATLHLAWTHHLMQLKGFRETFAKEQLAAELTKRNAQLDAIGAARSQLFAIASHDLRGPVHAIGLTVGQLDEHAGALLLGRQFEKLREQTSLVAEMLGDMMDLSRLERQDVQPNLVSVDLDLMFEQLRLNFEGIAHEKGLQLRLQTDGGWVLSDRHLLRRVLFNLVSNAIRYTARGEVVVQSQRHEGLIDILISDTGVGIAASTQESIFEDYVQLSHTGASAEGMGLGLPFARRAVAKLGHKLTLQSEVGKGSTFTVSAAAAQPGDADSTTAALASPDGGLPCVGTVLVVENDLFTLNALCGLLEKWGYLVIGGAGGEELRVKLDDAKAPGLVIADSQLSHSESGLDVIAAIRLRYGKPDLAALLLTGDLDPLVEAQAAERGVVLVHKPLAPAQLRREIEALID